MSGPWSDDPSEPPVAGSAGLLITTTTIVEGRPPKAYLGVVTGEAIMGANIFRDLFAGIRDVIGGRSGAYESVLRDGREQAFDQLAAQARDLGADAVIGVQIGYQALGSGDSMLMVAVTGTAVKL